MLSKDVKDSLLRLRAGRDLKTDDIFLAKHSIPIKYRKNLYWIMSESTLEKIRKLKDGNGKKIVRDVNFVLGQQVIINDWAIGIERFMKQPYDLDEKEGGI